MRLRARGYGFTLGFDLGWLYGEQTFVYERSDSWLRTIVIGVAGAFTPIYLFVELLPLW
jgi:hypothetical protein